MNLRHLDALRGALAVYVLLGHCRWLLWAGHSAWLGSAPAVWEVPLAFGSGAFRYGREAVMVFFVLSGFFIHLRAAQALPAELAPLPLPAGTFLARRAHRLVAPYGLALLVTVLCDLAGIPGRLWRYRAERRPVSAATVRSYLRLRRHPAPVPLNGTVTGAVG